MDFYYVKIAFYATLFTRFVTALGASMVFLFKKVSNKIMSLMFGFGAGVMIAASFFSLILPGIELCVKSLSNNTSLLPNIELRPVNTIFAKNTVDCINSGIVIGHIEMIEGCIRRYKKETNNENLNVVFTGGHTFLLNKLINPNYIINPNLTLEGLNKIIELNK